MTIPAATTDASAQSTHAPAGTWSLWRVTVTDRSGNIRQTSGKAFGASFTNS